MIAGGRRPTLLPQVLDGGSVLPGATARDHFQIGEVSRLLGISRRQLRYWAQTDLVRPGARTPGGHSRYTFEDLVALRTAKCLIDAGISLQRIRRSIGALRRKLPSVRRPLTELVLVATGDVVLAFQGGTAFDAISGQEWVIEVAELERDVEAWRRSRRSRRRARPATRGRERGDARTA